MSLKLKISDTTGFVFEKKQPVAEIHLDYLRQVSAVVLYADSSEETQLQVLRLAAWYTQQFVRNRSVSVAGGLLRARYRNSASDSRWLMDFQLISGEIQKLNRDTIINLLCTVPVDVIIAIHKTAEEAIKDVIKQVGIPDLCYSLTEQDAIFANEIHLQCAIPKPRRFIFWKSEDPPKKANQDHGLHIIPPYHPVMRGWKSVGMVNGDTDRYIRGNAVQGIYCPDDARSYPSIASSWAHINHPFFAVGNCLSLKLVTTRLRSQEGVTELTELLRAVLEQDHRYVEINGGFCPPMKCAHNRLLELKQRSPWPLANYTKSGHLARGSEAHCVWAYRTLEAEGALDQAYIPPWFYKEGWLKIYEGVEVHHKLH